MEFQTVNLTSIREVLDDSRYVMKFIGAAVCHGQLGVEERLGAQIVMEWLDQRMNDTASTLLVQDRKAPS
ncbi:hypothetical protein P3856_04570 [Pseudomonas aeruginosa]|uniref:hypothetical protein n=1 Tax=Pseudomonas aeruginosa TaxID=287 RepID=UPI0003BB4249|nr:hypothetical protein [Pseudomonas aeruginosa]ELL1274953.1 hypothetical protein [Pseudomonas aeruginosa]ERY94752.1 hypothetical protein Q021_02060 [Pseudomonas aeruginosa BWHPSA008]MBG5650755.1 hypothetical protein [Pseudomonas aeruginosa]MCF3988272.1 hypothetical protein [Pseudomonas aeruginosa]MCM8589977.1 hypothetical protein [Pseudomonas aeruginosa]